MCELPEHSILPRSVATKAPQCLLQLACHILSLSPTNLTHKSPPPTLKTKPSPKPQITLTIPNFLPFSQYLTSSVWSSACLLPSQPCSPLNWRSYCWKKQQPIIFSHSPSSQSSKTKPHTKKKESKSWLNQPTLFSNQQHRMNSRIQEKQYPETELYYPCKFPYQTIIIVSHLGIKIKFWLPYKDQEQES